MVYCPCLHILRKPLKKNIVTSPRDVLHLVVDDDWCDVMLLLEDFRCLGGEGCGGVGAGDVMDGCKC